MDAGEIPHGIFGFPLQDLALSDEFMLAESDILYADVLTLQSHSPFLRQQA